MSMIITSVQGNLSYSDPSKLTDEYRNAASITRLWIKEVALGISKQKGYDVDKSEFFRSKEYMDCFFKAVVDYTKWVEVVGSQCVDSEKSTHSGELNIGEIMKSILQIYIGVELADGWGSLTALLAGDVDTSVKDFMTFWWSNVNRNNSNSDMQVGPTFLSSDNECKFTIVQYSYSFQLNDWRSLFISSHYEEFDIYSLGNTFQIDMSVYKDYEAEIKKKLGVEIEKGIHDAPIG